MREVNGILDILFATEPGSSGMSEKLRLKIWLLAEQCM